MPEPAATVDVFDVVDYFLLRDKDESSDADVTHLELQKVLLYLAQANYLAATEQRLFDEDLLAYKNGPGVRKVWRKYRGTATTLVHSGLFPTEQPNLSPLVEDFLDKVWARFDPQSPSALRNLTNGQDPWKHHSAQDEPHVRIPDEDMIDFFVTRAPATARVYPVASRENAFEPATEDEPWATGMFARPTVERSVYRFACTRAAPAPRRFIHQPSEPPREPEPSTAPPARPVCCS